MLCRSGSFGICWGWREGIECDQEMSELSLLKKRTTTTVESSHYEKNMLTETEDILFYCYIVMPILGTKQLGNKKAAHKVVKPPYCDGGSANKGIFNYGNILGSLRRKCCVFSHHSQRELFRTIIGHTHCGSANLKWVTIIPNNSGNAETETCMLGASSFKLT